jgi:hypothetical protein
MNEFSFVIGRPWDKKDPENICSYMIHNSQVHYGTMEAAEQAKNYVEDKTKKKEYIYKLVKIK